MTDEINPRATMGGNRPPPPTPEEIAAELEERHEALLLEAARFDLALGRLPDKLETDEDAAAITDAVLAAKKISKTADEGHTEAKKPYLDGGRAVDRFFNEVREPLAAAVKALTLRVDAYNRAKAEAERQARLAREAEERRKAQEAARAAEEARRAAEAAAAEQEAAAARIRSSADTEEREEAREAMSAAGQQAVAQRAQAEELEHEAAQAERTAEAEGKAAQRAGQTAKITAGGGSATQSTFWNHRITDHEALFESFGPLRHWLSNDAIMQAINGCKRQHVTAGTISTVQIPGVEFFEDTKTNITATRRR